MSILRSDVDLTYTRYLYNDAIYLSERLAEFAAAWKKRDDITPRAQALLRLDGDIKSLQNFANRAYSSEMNIQKTILRDYLGGKMLGMLLRGSANMSKSQETKTLCSKTTLRTASR